MKAFAFQAALLEPLTRSARAWIFATKFFDQFLITVDEAVTALDGGFAVESPSGACS
jgi:hypothetical protein